MRHRPFEHATRADGFDAKTIETLLSELPAPDGFRELTRAAPGGATRGCVRGVALLANPRFGPTWKAMVEEGLSQEHYLRWLALFRPRIDRRYPDLDARFGRLEGLRAVPRHRLRAGSGEVGLECRLVFQTPGSTAGLAARDPHVGRPTTLLRAMIDLRWPGDRSADGRLEFHVPIEPAHCFEFGRQLPRTSVRTTHAFPRENGRLVTFLNSIDAIHGRTAAEPADLPRLYVDLMVEFSEPVFPISVRSEPRARAAAPSPPVRSPVGDRLRRWLRGR